MTNEKLLRVLTRYAKQATEVLRLLKAGETMSCRCEETACSVMEDGQHCNHWYDGEPCCACEAPACTCEVGGEG